MKKRELADSAVYRWRYWLGYMALIVLFCAAITAASLYAPGGVSEAEIEALSTTNAISPTNLGSFAQTNLPFHLLQRGLFSVFGVTVYTIKLPSLILSFIAAVAVFFLLRRWFKPNVTILSLVIMTVTGQLIFFAQSFTPHILYITYAALILLFASLIVQRAKGSALWRLLLATTVGLSLFTPYFWYIHLTLLLVALIHPHTRYALLAKRNRFKWLPAIVVLALTSAPAIFLAATHHDLLKSLVGIHSLSWALVDNLRLLLYHYLWVKPTVIGGQIAPVLDFSALFLIVLGLFKTIQHHHTARSYMIGVWLLLSLPLLVLQPSMTSIIILPLFILLAVGVEALLNQWYSLFPRNPYARITGLLMLMALIGVMVLSGLDRFTNGYRHFSGAVHEFSTDLPLLQKAIAGRQNVVLVANPHEAPLYETVARYSKYKLTVNQPAAEGATLVITRAEQMAHPNTDGWTLERIVTNSHTERADRFYLYKSAKK